MSVNATCSSICYETGIENDAPARPSARAGRLAAPDLEPAYEGHAMNAMVATPPTHLKPTQLNQCRVRLAASPAAAGEARSQVRAAIRDWGVPVDPDTAVLLASELVTNAITHETGGSVTLGIGCFRGRLRVDVYDTSRSFPVVSDAPGDAETGRGLMLVAALATEWGFYRTPAGKAVYFTLVFDGDQTAALPADEAVLA
jgi:anti-sigma regulatory factor (Ser/Thr protein kinase)